MERRKTIISFLIIKWSFFAKPWVPFTQECSIPSLVEIDPMVLQKNIFIFRQCIFDVGGALHLNELEHPSPKHALCHVWLNLGALESPSPKDALCQVWLNLAEWFLRRFLNFVNMFSSFLNYLPLEEIGVALHLNKVWLNYKISLLFKWFMYSHLSLGRFSQCLNDVTGDFRASNQNAILKQC